MRRVTRRLKASATATEPRLIVSTLRGAAVLARSGRSSGFEAADNYARVWSAGKSFLMRESLADLEQRIGTHGFARAHRRALVRISAVRALSGTREGDLTVELESGIRIQCPGAAVPRSRKQSQRRRDGERASGVPGL
jgi:two-component system LytT family response regulator